MNLKEFQVFLVLRKKLHRNEKDQKELKGMFIRTPAYFQK